MDKINFLYCFDNNYNKQAFTSMISLLDNVSEKINIFIIHSDKNIIDDIPNRILKHKYLEFFESYQFTDYQFKFANLEKVHVSVATYFRLFISNYLPNDIENIIFIDPDIICVKDPIAKLKVEIEKLNNSNFILSAKTEHSNGRKEIGVKNNYFNAGFMILNFKKWNKNNMQSELINKLNEINNEITQWDQDVLNSFFDGNYIELNQNFNFKAATKISRFSKNSILFIHFIGSQKPWLTSGTFEKDANFYHKNYRKINNTNFHITHKWKTRSLLDLIYALVTLRLFRLNKPFIYIYEFIKSIFL